MQCLYENRQQTSECRRCLRLHDDKVNGKRCLIWPDWFARVNTAGFGVPLIACALCCQPRHVLPSPGLSQTARGLRARVSCTSMR